MICFIQFSDVLSLNNFLWLFQLQRKRHIGNDIVCVVFLEADGTNFSPACIKSHFLHTFIVVRTSPTKRRYPTMYEVSVVSRDEVGAFKPFLHHQSVFKKVIASRCFSIIILLKLKKGSVLKSKLGKNIL